VYTTVGAATGAVVGAATGAEVGAVAGVAAVVAVAALTFFFAGVAAVTVAAGAVATVAAGATGTAELPGLVAVAAGATGASGVTGVELAASSAIWVFQAKLEIIVRKAVDEIVAAAMRARRAGCGLRVINLVITATFICIVAVTWLDWCCSRCCSCGSGCC